MILTVQVFCVTILAFIALTVCLIKIFSSKRKRILDKTNKMGYSIKTYKKYAKRLPTHREARKMDRDAIQSDWRAVGNDIREAIKNYEKKMRP